MAQLARSATHSRERIHQKRGISPVPVSEDLGHLGALEMNELHSPASPSPLPLLHRRVLPQQAQSGKTGQHLNSEALRQPYLLMARVTTHLQVLPGR